MAEKRKKPAKKIKKEPRQDTTGMLFIREASTRYDSAKESLMTEGRRLVMVAGILALPVDANLSVEHQFVVSGTTDRDGLHLTIHLDGAINQKDVTLGLTIDGVLMRPIWRI